jgi:hypothetical protein
VAVGVAVKKPSFSGRLRFILVDPRYSTYDRLEYLDFLLYTLSALLLLLLGMAWSIAQRAVGAGKCVLYMGVIFGFLPLLVWHRARHFNQRFVHPYHALLLGEESAQDERRKSELVKTYAAKSFMAALSFHMALAVILVPLMILTILFIFIAMLLQLDTWILIGVPLGIGLIMIPIGIALHRHFGSQSTNFDKRTFQNLAKWIGFGSQSHSRS